MIRLYSSAKGIKFRLAGPVALNQVPIVVSYYDNDLIGGTAYEESDDTNDIVVLDNPSTNNLRSIDFIEVLNTDSADITVEIFLVTADGETPLTNETLHTNEKLVYDGNWHTIGSGTVPGIVTALSIATTNGFAGSSSGGATPVITLSTTVTGVIKGNGTAMLAATDPDITGFLLTGFVSTPGTVTATDSILSAIEKLSAGIGVVPGLPDVLAVDPTTGANDIILSNNAGVSQLIKDSYSGSSNIQFIDNAGVSSVSIVGEESVYLTSLTSSIGISATTAVNIGGTQINLTGFVESNGHIRAKAPIVSGFTGAYDGIFRLLTSGVGGVLDFTIDPTQAISYSLQFPKTDSTGTQALVSNGSGVLSWASFGSGTVTSVSGTANRITSTGGATPVINIDAAYDALWQPIDADLTAIAALGFASTSFLKKTGAGTWALDTNVYLNELGTTIGATTNIQEFTIGIQSAVFNASYILGSFGTGLELIGSTTSKLHLNHSGADVTELGDADNVGNGTRLVIDDANKTIDFYNSTPVFQFNGEAILTDVSTATLTNKSGLISQWTNDAGYLTSAPASTIIVGSTTITGGANGRIPYNSSGFYQESANLVWDNGNSQLSILSSGTASLPAVAIGAADLGFFSPAANELAVTTGGSERFRFSSTYFRSPTTGGPNLRRAAGAVGTPTYAFNGAVTTGMWLNGTFLDFSVGGVAAGGFSGSGVFKLYNAGGTFGYNITAANLAADRTLNIPLLVATDTFAMVDFAQTLTNKTMTGATNTLTASLLKSATTEVDVSASTAPSSGQVLTATSSTTATWQTPSGGGLSIGLSYSIARGYAMA